MDTTDTSFDGVKRIIVSTLGIEGRADGIDASTPLFGAMPELDSLAVLELMANLEEHFGFTVDDEEFSGDIFETVGSLTAFVDQKRS